MSFTRLFKQVNMEGLGEELPVSDTTGERDKEIEEDAELYNKVTEATKLTEDNKKLEEETKEYVATLEEEGELEDNSDILEGTIGEVKATDNEINQEDLNILRIKLLGSLSRLAKYNYSTTMIAKESFNSPIEEAMYLSKLYKEQLTTIRYNQEGLLASIITGIGGVMTSLEKHTRSRKGFLKGMLNDLSKNKYEIEDGMEDKFNDKYPNLINAYLMYIEGDNDLLIYLQNNLKIIEGGIKISYASVPTQKVPNKLHSIESSVEKELKSKLSVDDNILPNPDGVDLEYQDHKIVGICALKDKIVCDYCIKYNRGLTFHTYTETMDRRNHMELSIDTAKVVLQDALRNIDQVANLITRIRDSSIKVAKLHSEADKVEDKWYKKIFLKKTDKYKDIVNTYYNLVETYSRFILRNLAKQDNLQTEETIGDVASGVYEGTKAVAKGAFSVVRGTGKAVKSLFSKKDEY